MKNTQIISVINQKGGVGKVKVIGFDKGKVKLSIKDVEV